MRSWRRNRRSSTATSGPGIDLVFTGAVNKLKYEFVFGPTIFVGYRA
jgi:hypothetical protein